MMAQDTVIMEEKEKEKRAGSAEWLVDRRAAMATLVTAALAAPCSALASPFAGGVLSLTYDDGLDSHLDIAAPALAARGLFGTFYVTLENIAKRAAEWRRLAATGQELANHTVSHPCDLGTRHWGQYSVSEIAPLNRTLTGWDETLSRPDFAYPCDVTNLGPGTPNQQLRRFETILRAEDIASARTSEGRPNSAGWVRAHPYRLQALAAGFDAKSLAQLVGYVRQAQMRNRWAILVFHDIVRAHPCHGQTLAHVHEALIDVVVRMQIRCRRVCDVMKEIQT
jgi:peptidoglycan/xylan/chitin deacetylase (PgdA/CDA1 family)